MPVQPQLVPEPLDAPPLMLRPWQQAYAPALWEAVRQSQAGVGRWLPWCHADYDLDEALRWIAFCQQGWDDGDHYAFAVFDAQDQLVGGAGLNQIDRRDWRANLGYWIRDSATGQGYASRAARAVATFGFATLVLNRIEIVAATGNLASQRCAERLGAQREGVARRRVVLHGNAEDAVIYGLVADDLTSPR